MAVDNGDYFKITVSASVGNKTCYYEYDMTNISSDTYPYIKLRYKTSDASIKAQVVLVFTAGTQTVLTESSSTTFDVDTVSITAGKTIDKIRIYANQATGDVYYDFFMIYKGAFTIPNAAEGMDIDLPPRDSVTDIPSKHTDSIQRLGSKSVPVHISCDLTEGTWTRTGDSIDGQVFWDIFHNSHSEPWQWFNTGVGHQFKVTVHAHFLWSNMGDSTMRRIEIDLLEYSKGDKSEEGYLERAGIGL